MNYQTEISAFHSDEPNAHGALLASIGDNDALACIRWLHWGANPNARNAKGHTALMLACQSRAAVRLNAVKALVLAGAELDEQDGHGSTALHFAMLSGDVDQWETATYLWKQGASLTLVDRDGLTPLEVALTDGVSQGVLTLLTAGMSPDVAGPSGSLLWYASYADVDVARDLIQRGAHVNAPCPIWLHTPLHRAIDAYFECDPEAAGEMIQLLLDAGADVNAPDRNGKTPAALADGKIPVIAAALGRAKGECT